MALFDIFLAGSCARTTSTDLRSAAERRTVWTAPLNNQITLFPGMADRATTRFGRMVETRKLGRAMTGGSAPMLDMPRRRPTPRPCWRA